MCGSEKDDQDGVPTLLLPTEIDNWPAFGGASDGIPNQAVHRAARLVLNSKYLCPIAAYDGDHADRPMYLWDQAVANFANVHWQFLGPVQKTLENCPPHGCLSWDPPVLAPPGTCANADHPVTLGGSSDDDGAAHMAQTRAASSDEDIFSPRVTRGALAQKTAVTQCNRPPVRLVQEHTAAIVQSLLVTNPDTVLCLGRAWNEHEANQCAEALLQGAANDHGEYRAAIRYLGMTHFQLATSQRIADVLQGNFPQDEKSSERRVEHLIKQVKPSTLLSLLPQTVTTAMPHNELLRTLIETIVAAVQDVPEVDVMIIASAKSDRPQVVQTHFDDSHVYSTMLLGSKVWDVLPACSLQTGGTGKENERHDVSPQTHGDLPWQHATVLPGQTLLLNSHSWHRVTTHGAEHGSLVINVMVVPTEQEAVDVTTPAPVRHNSASGSRSGSNRLPKIRAASAALKTVAIGPPEKACRAHAAVSVPLPLPDQCPARSVPDR